MPTRLTAKMAAPGFKAHVIDGRVISLGQFRTQLVWLAFYRYPTCPMCNLHLSSVLRKSDFLKQLGVNFLAVFETVPELFPSHLKELRHPNFFLISDPEHWLYQHYGVEKKLSAVFRPAVALKLLTAVFSGFPQGKIRGSLGRVPAHFLIAEDGLIERAHYGEHIGDNLPWSEVEAFFSSRRGGSWALKSRVR